MNRVYVFGDEAGNFDFSLKVSASKYFMIGTVAMRAPELGSELIALRRNLAMRGIGLETVFHASEDRQKVRNAVFDVIGSLDFRFDVTVLEKRKAMPRIRPTWERFYKYAWYYHLKYVCPRIAGASDELLVVASSLGIRAKFNRMRAAIDDVVKQSTQCRLWKAAFWPCSTDPCLVIADYCTWAVQRKYELNDDRSYRLIQSKIGSEFRLFDAGSTYFY